MEAARRHLAAGAGCVVDLDLDSFFDRVEHDALMARVAWLVSDKRVLRLIRRYLDAGVMAGGVVQRTEEGTPQGSLSPLLASVMLDDLDRALERRGHRFVRRAGDLIGGPPCTSGGPGAGGFDLPVSAAFLDPRPLVANAGQSRADDRRRTRSWHGG